MSEAEKGKCQNSQEETLDWGGTNIEEDGKIYMDKDSVWQEES